MHGDGPGMLLYSFIAHNTHCVDAVSKVRPSLQFNCEFAKQAVEPMDGADEPDLHASHCLNEKPNEYVSTGHGLHDMVDGVTGLIHPVSSPCASSGHCEAVPALHGEGVMKELQYEPEGHGRHDDKAALVGCSEPSGHAMHCVHCVLLVEQDE